MPIEWGWVKLVKIWLYKLKCSYIKTNLETGNKTSKRIYAESNNNGLIMYKLVYKIVQNLVLFRNKRLRLLKRNWPKWNFSGQFFIIVFPFLESFTQGEIFLLFVIGEIQCFVD